MKEHLNKHTMRTDFFLDVLELPETCGFGFLPTKTQERKVV